MTDELLGLVACRLECTTALWPLTLQATPDKAAPSCAACRLKDMHAFTATQVGLISPFARLPIAQAIDSVAGDASLRQDALCSLRADGLQRCQGIALNLQAHRQAVCWVPASSRPAGVGADNILVSSPNNWRAVA